MSPAREAMPLPPQHKAIGPTIDIDLLIIHRTSGILVVNMYAQNIETLQKHPSNLTHL